MLRTKITLVLAFLSSPLLADDFSFSAKIGGMSVLSSDSDVSYQPFLKLGIVAPTASAVYAPNLEVGVSLGALPGESLDASDVKTFKSLEAKVGLSQKIPYTYINIYGEVGFASRILGDTEPAVRAPKFVSAGLLFRNIEKTRFLKVGYGTDQRINGLWKAAITASGEIAIAEKEVGKTKVELILVSEAILSIYATDRRDIITAGIAVKF